MIMDKDTRDLAEGLRLDGRPLAWDQVSHGDHLILCFSSQPFHKRQWCANEKEDGPNFGSAVSVGEMKEGAEAHGGWSRRNRVHERMLIAKCTAGLVRRLAG